MYAANLECPSNSYRNPKDDDLYRTNAGSRTGWLKRTQRSSRSDAGTLTGEDCRHKISDA